MADMNNCFLMGGTELGAVDWLTKHGLVFFRGHDIVCIIVQPPRRLFSVVKLGHDVHHLPKMILH